MADAALDLPSGGAGQFLAHVSDLSDTDRAISGAYGVETMKGRDFPQRVTFVIAPDGTIARRIQVTDIGGHPAEVLAAIRESM